MEPILRGLNVAQRAAVTSTASVLQVLAPPGSGKTKTLTSRVAYLLAHHGYQPWNVICCTFTIKASREMRERLRGMIGNDVESRLVLGTFHSICRRYLVHYGHLIGLPKNFGIADSDDSLNIIKRVVKRLGLCIDPRAARSRISHRKARGKRLEDAPKPTKNIEAEEFATVFQEYEDALQQSNLLDYDDLLLQCVDLLRQHPDCVSNVEALLIDEFQDTNIVQFELMKLLASAKKRITIVGDPDQSIYGFRSAEIANLSRMRTYYPDAVVINLEENYRSCSAILKLAQEVIEQDNDRPNKKLKSTHRYGTLPVLRRLPNPYEEAHWIAAEIRRIMKTTGDMIHYSDISILLRSAFLSLHIEKALANKGIPYKMVGGRRFFDRVEVRIILDYLRTICNPDNNSALLSIINTPKRKVGDTTIKELTNLAEQNKDTLWNTIQKVLSGQTTMNKKLSAPSEQGLKTLVTIIQRGQKKISELTPEKAPRDLMEYIAASLNFQDFLKKEYPEDHEERWENVQELLNQARDAVLQFDINEEQLPQIEGLQQESGNTAHEMLYKFLANVALSTEVENEDGEASQKITISTIHSAKGLEWPVVFIPAIYEGSIPHSRAEDTNEERRLLYVAITRAKALLYMTFPIMQQRGESESILSQFISPSAKALTTHIGPVFSHNIVNDMADILRCEAPSPSDLAKGVRELKENESAEDDLWPADGSHKSIDYGMESAFVGTHLRPGQTLSAALLRTSSFEQRSGYSTIAGILPTTEESKSSANFGTAFTTASHHHKTQPQPVESKPRSLGLSGKVDVRSMKTLEAFSGKGTIQSFFSSASVSKQSSAVQSSGSAAKLQQSTRHMTEGAHQAATDTIPSDLRSHRLTSTSSLLKRPRSVLSAIDGMGDSQHNKRNHYAAFENAFSADGSKTTTAQPDSKTTDQQHVKAEVVKTSDLVEQRDTRGLLTAQNEKNPVLQYKPLTTYNTTMSKLQGVMRGTVQPNSNIRSTGTTTLAGQGNNTSMIRTTMNALQTDPNRNKTLGVRRSMTGWADRKHR